MTPPYKILSTSSHPLSLRGRRCRRTIRTNISGIVSRFFLPGIVPSTVIARSEATWQSPPSHPLSLRGGPAGRRGNPFPSACRALLPPPLGKVSAMPTERALRPIKSRTQRNDRLRAISHPYRYKYIISHLYCKFNQYFRFFQTNSEHNALRQKTLAISKFLCYNSGNAGFVYR